MNKTTGSSNGNGANPERTFLEKIEMATRWRRNELLRPAKWIAYETGQTKFVPPPDRLYIESTNICNLSCIMCPTGRKEQIRKKGYMDFELFKSIVDEMAPWVQATTLHIWGEPLLHPRLFDMIAYCARKGLRSEISTNATLLNEERSRRILDAGLGAIYLCLDGMRPETYEAIRVNADYEKTNSHIRRFIELKQAGGYQQPFVNLQIIEMERTVGEVDEFVKAWSLPGVDRINVKPFDSWAGQVTDINGLAPEAPRVPAQRYACPNLWYHTHIYWDGRLAMCDRDFNLAYDLGNVRSADGVVRVLENWNGPKMQELRRLHLRNDLDHVSPCNTCTEWAWWKPSPFRSHGNYNATKLQGDKK
ncbi:MAG: molybdenum cofactor biosynthesis protein A [Chloroflexi bacterium ADurb.Bin325]|nr:MAG: molybdenum cofactor biosynthesis protein A [Chloroflexi bacterium ADurb.Bin325]